MRFFGRLLFAYAVERLCERISPTVLITVRFGPELLDQISEAAMLKDMGVTDYIRAALRDGLKRGAR